MPSAAGEALHRLPPMVPAFWTWMPPTTAAACCSARIDAGSDAEATSVQVVVAPMRIPSGPMPIPRSSSTPVRSRTGSVSGRPTLTG